MTQKDPLRERVNIVPIIKGIHKGEYKANARLIANAPEMYDELYENLQFFKGNSVDERDEYAKYARSIQALLARIDGEEDQA